ncbi:uncharacterized protein LOC117008779 isoform X2 [Catharus ustulatus]|uniref:uncharacterized protein LOC117008779 isoform X2 n=1 Tax=Catharus ustulatus TaxID=91951 RepID=UPI0014082A37|nr:uncharacterized protein LOC117008779 isoform X2 [Catharus ustulatus]
MRSHPAALTLPGGKLPRFATQQSETPLRGQLRQRGAAGSVRSARLRCGTGALPARCRGARSAQRPPSHFLPPRGLPGTVPPSSSGAASAADTQPSTMNFCIAVLLVLHSLPGKVELEDDLEEMAQDLYDYMAHLSNYYDSTYSTEDYYYDNITATPATYVYDLESYEVSWVSPGIPQKTSFPHPNLFFPPSSHSARMVTGHCQVLTTPELLTLCV